MRLNEANHYQAISSIVVGGQITDANEWTDEHRRIATGRFNLANLARLLGVGASEVYLMTYTVSEEISTQTQGKILIDSMEYPLELIRLQKPRFCVECFKADKKDPDKYPYHRRIWDFAHYTVCTEHYTLHTKEELPIYELDNLGGCPDFCVTALFKRSPPTGLRTQS